MTEACGAELPPLRDYGWTCTGSSLVIVLHVAHTPIVLPTRALEIHDPQSWWETPVVPFTGGDHMHLCVPRRPPPRGWRFDGVLVIQGGVATPMRRIYGAREAMT